MRREIHYHGLKSRSFLPGQTFSSAACSYLTLRMLPPPKLLLLGNRPIHFRPSIVFISTWVHRYTGSGVCAGYHGHQARDSVGTTKQPSCGKCCGIANGITSGTGMCTALFQTAKYRGGRKPLLEASSRQE